MEYAEPDRVRSAACIGRRVQRIGAGTGGLRVLRPAEL